MAHHALSRSALRGAQQTLRAFRRVASCPSPPLPSNLDDYEPSTSCSSRASLLCCPAISNPQTWRLAPATSSPSLSSSSPKGFTSVAGPDLKPPSSQQPVPDPEVMKHVEAALGPLDSKPLAPPARPVVVVISGPSGVGKDAVLVRLQQQRPDLYFVVTATSRSKRPGEVEGRDYFFVSKARFQQWISEGMLLEHALVYGEYKGIPRQQVDAALAAGTDVVLRIDVQGAATVKRLMPDCVSIFVTADSEEMLVRRLVARKTEPLDKLLVRVQTARSENAHIANFDYVVVNRDGALDDCVRQVSGIIEAEKAKVSRRLPPPPPQAGAAAAPSAGP